MEVVTRMDYTIEPELLSPIPRRTRHRNRGDLILTLVFQFSVLLLVGLGLAMFVYFCLQLTLGNSPTIEGRIVEIKTPETTATETPEAEKPLATNARDAVVPRLPTLEYTFTVNNHQIDGSTTIMPQQIKLLPDSNAIRVRCLPYLVSLGYRPILPNDTFWGWVGILGLITLVAEVVIGTLSWFAFVLPARQRQLCRYGRPAPGTVIRKEMWGSGTCVVHYRFEPHAGTLAPDAMDTAKNAEAGSQEKPAAETLGHARVSKEFWEKTEAGDKVTVLYMPKDPDRNALYLPGMYCVDPGAFAVVRMREDSVVKR